MDAETPHANNAPQPHEQHQPEGTHAANPHLRSNAAAIHDLSELRTACSLPGPLFRVLDALRDERGTKFTVSRSIEQDPDLAERVLKAANSPLYLTYEDRVGGAGAGITNLPTAVLRIGLSAVRNLAYTQGLCQLTGDTGQLGIGILAHLLVVAEICWSLGSRVSRPFAEDAYLAGLLHDFGKIVLLKTLPDDYAAIAGWCRQHNQATLAVEEECFRETQPLLLNHVKTGAELMRAHYMPEGVLFSVEHHHDPLVLNLHGRNPRHLTATVIIADQLAYASGMGDGFGAPGTANLPLADLADLMGKDAAGARAMVGEAADRARLAWAQMPRQELPLTISQVRSGAGQEPGPTVDDLAQPVSPDYLAYEKLIGYARAVSRFNLQDLQAHTGLDGATLEDLIARLEDKGYLKRDRRHTYHRVYRATQSLQRSSPQEILSTLAVDTWRHPGERRIA